MKILLLMLLSLNIYADELVEYPEDSSYIPSEKTNWNFYKTDSCTMYNKSNDLEDELREIGFRRCRDNSISFVQPPSRGVQGWEGKCGQTFGSNALYSICKKVVDPNIYFNQLFSDITPGVRPGTLKKGMKKAFKKESADCPQVGENNWRFFKRGNNQSFIKRVKADLIPNYSHIGLIQVNRFGKSYLRNPIGVLIQNPGGNYLHWVTVVDVLSSENSCEFVVNHWDNQYQVPCEELASWSGKVGRTYPIILSSYSTVVFK